MATEGLASSSGDKGGDGTLPSWRQISIEDSQLAERDLFLSIQRRHFPKEMEEIKRKNIDPPNQRREMSLKGTAKCCPDKKKSYLNPTRFMQSTFIFLYSLLEPRNNDYL